jgi:hypothetical protein
MAHARNAKLTAQVDKPGGPVKDRALSFIYSEVQSPGPSHMDRVAPIHLRGRQGAPMVK